MSAAARSMPALSFIEYSRRVLCFPAAAARLGRSRRRGVNDDALADYVALGWLEQADGAWRLTPVGQRVCELREQRALV